MKHLILALISAVATFLPTYVYFTDKLGTAQYETAEVRTKLEAVEYGNMLLQNQVSSLGGQLHRAQIAQRQQPIVLSESRTDLEILRALASQPFNVPPLPDSQPDYSQQLNRQNDLLEREIGRRELNDLQRSFR
jgi:vacuolar-type H+-ATPase subunit I/STV1